MTATFLLIRHAAHGQLDRRLCGRAIGVALNDAGLRQADDLARTLRDASIGRILTSPLERTRQTAAAIARALPQPLPVEDDEALIEIDMGDWTGRTFDSLDDDPAWRDWNARRGKARIPGGETMAEAQRRIATRLDALAHAAADGQVVAVVTHGDMIRGAVAHVLGLDLDHLLRFDVDPASVTRLVWGKWGARLLQLNARGVG